jgi:hypothetical protein
MYSITISSYTRFLGASSSHEETRPNVQWHLIIAKTLLGYMLHVRMHLCPVAPHHN